MKLVKGISIWILIAARLCKNIELRLLHFNCLRKKKIVYLQSIEMWLSQMLYKKKFRAIDNGSILLSIAPSQGYPHNTIEWYLLTGVLHW